ncbi:MAG: 50S ribosomal protein L25 [Planctomycetota bacterium]|nr:50S ribosomal protein L25 [Planctomycetota bacterium]
MSHENPTLSAQQRERHGSRYAQRLRKSGRLPAVVYGHGSDPVSISVDEKETLKHLHGGGHVFNLEIDGGTAETCLVKDLQFGYLGDDVIHIDFARVDLDQKVRVNMTLDFHGTPAAAKKGGSITVHDLNELEIECTVRNMPDALRIDLEEFDDIVHVNDLKLPEGVEAITPGTTLVLHVQAPKGGDAADEGDGDAGAGSEAASES